MSATIDPQDVNTYDPKALKLLGDLSRLTPAQLRDFRMLDLQGIAPAETEQEGESLTTWADMSNSIGPISWAWPEWLPNGFLSMLAAGQGEGKSALALRVAGCFLRGDPWPNGTPFDGETGAILWCEAEAAQALNLERAQRWGYPLDKIYTPLADGMEDFKLDDPNHLNALTVKAYNPAVKLIVIDSLSGAKANIEKDPEQAAVVKTLAALARDTGKPILVLHHLRKRGMMDLNNVDLDRVRGSSSLTQPARVVWAIDTPDPYNEARKRFKTIKNNLGKFAPPIGLMMGDTLTFGAAPEEPKTETVTDKAVDLLMALLRSEPKPAAIIQDEFDAAGISNASMRRAKDRLGIVSVKDRDGWKWSLPAQGVENVN